MPLRIPRTAPISDKEEDAARSAWGTMDDVLSDLADRGITLSDTPPDFPLPDVTTTLVADDNSDYLKTNARHLAWLNHISPWLAVIKGTLLEVENEKTDIATTYKQRVREAEDGLPRAQKKSKDEVEDDIWKDVRHRELTRQQQKLLQKKLLLEEKRDILERTLKVISRHVEVMKLDADMNRTGVNMPARRPFNRPGGR